MHIKDIKLTHFRNIEQVHLSLEEASVVVLCGANGAGKTSVLEALALLSPGRGLHRAPLSNHVQHDAPLWGIHAEVHTVDGLHTVGQTYTKEGSSKGRLVKMDGEKLAHQAELSKLGNVLWLTPKMDRLFMDGTASRREFFDRLVFSLFPDHAELMARYKHHIKARMALLKQGASADWLDIEEAQAASYAIQLQENREGYLKQFRAHEDGISLHITHCGDDYVRTWQEERAKDARLGMTNTGPHRLQLKGHLLPENIRLAETSTGQHKRAVLNILLTNARLIAAHARSAPLLLMDEVAAHLDAKTRKHFFDTFVSLGSQVWLTGTDVETFACFDEKLMFKVEKGVFKPYD